MCPSMTRPTAATAYGIKKRRASIIQEGQVAVVDTVARWQNPRSDLPDRRRMVKNIRQVMQGMITRPEMVHKIPIMSKKMEELLYRAARTREQYVDRSTLKTRIRSVARVLEKTRC